MIERIEALLGVLPGPRIGLRVDENENHMTIDCKPDVDDDDAGSSLTR
jgi:hypothetical protein